MSTQRGRGAPDRGGDYGQGVRPNRRSHHLGGLSLAETILAATVMSMVLLAVLTFLPGAMALVEKNKQTNIANYLAHDTLEGLAARPFPTLTLGPQDLAWAAIPQPYTATATVSTVDGYTPERLKRVEVTIGWPSRNRTLTVKQELYVHAVRR